MDSGHQPPISELLLAILIHGLLYFGLLIYISYIKLQDSNLDGAVSGFIMLSIILAVICFLLGVIFLFHRVILKGKLKRKFRIPSYGLALVAFFVIQPLQDHQEINIVSGRERTIFILFGYPVFSRVRDTELTRSLKTNGEAKIESQWRTINIGLRWYDREMCWGFCSSPYQIDELKRIWNRRDGFNAEARERSAKAIVQLWQANEGGDLAQKYLVELEYVVFKHDTSGKISIITPADLPSTEKILESGVRNRP